LKADMFFSYFVAFNLIACYLGLVNVMKHAEISIVVGHAKLFVISESL